VNEGAGQHFQAQEAQLRQVRLAVGGHFLLISIHISGITLYGVPY
jgi:hypothetical protein